MSVSRGLIAWMFVGPQAEPALRRSGRRRQQLRRARADVDLAFVHGDGAGSFGAPTVVEPGPFDLDGWIAIGDLTADGAPDLV